MIRLVVFDFFGTLGRFDESRPTSPVYLMWDRRTRKADLGELVRLVEGINGKRQFTGPPTSADYTCWQTEALRAAADYVGVPWTDTLHRDLLEVLNQRRLTLFDDSLPAVRALAERGIPWAVSSNASPDVEVKLLAAVPAGLEPAVVLTSCRVGARKPHPDMFTPFLSYVDDPAEVLFVGDRVDADVLGPRRLGFRTALVDRSGRSEPVPPGTAVLRSLNEILSLADLEAA